MVRDDVYRVERVLADGPGGRTELVSMEDEDGLLVRKRIPLELANASAWATLMGMSEPLLPRIESLYQMPDELVVVYEYVPGFSLAQLVENHGPLPRTLIESVMGDLCHAVGCLHARGIVHRDITPNNVIVDEQLNSHLVDLGIARQWSDGRAKDTTTLGTWGFAAPEQFGFAQTDARSDVYSLGRLLGYLLTGVRPSDEGYDTALAKLPTEGAALAVVARKASSFEPSARYQSAEELDEAVRTADLQAVDEPKAPVEERSGTAASQSAKAMGLRDEGAGLGNVSEDASRLRRVAEFLQSLRSMNAPTLVGLLLFWGALASLALLFMNVSIDSVLTGKPVWGPAEHTMSVVCSVALGFIGREAYLAALHRGRYARPRRPIVELLKRICFIIAITFIIMCIVAILLPNGKQLSQ